MFDRDPFVVAVGIGLLVAVAGGPAVVYALQAVPPHWQRAVTWLLIVGAAGFAVLTPYLPASLGLVVVIGLAALPGLVTYVAFRTRLASAIVTCAPLYFFIGALVTDRATFAPAIPLDGLIPVRPAWMLVYGSLYVFVVILPLMVVRQPDLLRRGMQAFLAVMLVSYAGFLLYPTVAPRPADIGGHGFTAWSLRLAYDLDPPFNCFPSLHVAYAFVAALTCYRVHRGVGLVATLWAALIGISTLYTKQHYVVDVIAGALLALVAYRIFLRPFARDAVDETVRRLAPLRALAVVGVFGFVTAGFWIAYRFQRLP